MFNQNSDALNLDKNASNNLVNYLINTNDSNDSGLTLNNQETKAKTIVFGVNCADVLEGTSKRIEQKNSKNDEIKNQEDLRHKATDVRQENNYTSHGNNIDTKEIKINHSGKETIESNSELMNQGDSGLLMSNNEKRNLELKAETVNYQPPNEIKARVDFQNRALVDDNNKSLSLLEKIPNDLQKHIILNHNIDKINEGAIENADKRAGTMVFGVRYDKPQGLVQDSASQPEKDRAQINEEGITNDLITVNQNQENQTADSSMYDSFIQSPRDETESQEHEIIDLCSTDDDVEIISVKKSLELIELDAIDDIGSCKNSDISLTDQANEGLYSSNNFTSSRLLEKPRNRNGSKKLENIQKYTKPYKTWNDSEDPVNKFNISGKSTGLLHQTWFNQQQELYPNRLYPPKGFNIEGNYASVQAETINDSELEENFRNLLTGINDKVDLDIKREETPHNLKIKLLEHQKIGLSWMLKMEDSPMKGGLLSDEMGLGKTIQTISCIVKKKTSWHIRCKTLIVAPLALIYQWYEEITTKVNKGFLKCHIYHRSSKGMKDTPLSDYDIVLTTYNTLTIEYKNFMKLPELANEDQPQGPKNKKTMVNLISPLIQTKWNRVILDESHMIKNRQTGAAKACFSLKSTYRWCLSGTPIQNSIDELYPVLKFLQIKPYCEWSRFNYDLSILPKKLNQEYKFKKVRVLLESMSLRRCKDSVLDGKPILSLPKKSFTTVSLDLTPKERAYYTALQSNSLEEFKKLEKAGTLKNNYINMLVLLLRLRQACCHPKLTRFKDYALIEEESGMDLTNKKDVFKSNSFNSETTEIMVNNVSNNAKCYICDLSILELKFVKGCSHTICVTCIESNFLIDDESCRSCYKACKSSSEKLIDQSEDEVMFFNSSDQSPIWLDKDGEVDDSFDPSEIDYKEILQNPSSSKIDKLLEILVNLKAQSTTSNLKKTIVFSQFTAFISVIYPKLQSEGIKCLVYDGTMDINERTKCIDKFNKCNEHIVMLMSLKCGSVGLNLTSASCVVFMDLWWNPAVENQAMDRVHRIGQDKEVEVFKLVVPETIEDRILSLQNIKQSLFDGAFGKDGKISTTSRLSLNELKFLFGAGPNPSQQLQSQMQKNRSISSRTLANPKLLYQTTSSQIQMQKNKDIGSHTLTSPKPAYQSTQIHSRMVNPTRFHPNLKPPQIETYNNLGLRSNSNPGLHGERRVFGQSDTLTSIKGMNSSIPPMVNIPFTSSYQNNVDSSLQSQSQPQGNLKRKSDHLNTNDSNSQDDSSKGKVVSNLERFSDHDKQDTQPILIDISSDYDDTFDILDKDAIAINFSQ